MQILLSSSIAITVLMLGNLNLLAMASSDRLAHVLVSATLLFFILTIDEVRTRLLVPATLIVFSLGWFKEFTDPTFDVIDLGADFIGCMLALLLIYLVHASGGVLQSFGSPARAKRRR